MKNGLFKNESIKIWNQTANRIIVIILAVIIILTPIFTFLISKLVSSFVGYDSNAKDMYENYLEYANSARNNEQQDIYTQTEVVYYETEASSLKFFIDNNIAESWKYELYYFNYSELMKLTETSRLLAEGTYSYEELMNSRLSYYLQHYRYNGIPYYYDSEAESYMQTYEDGTTAQISMTHEEFYSYLVNFTGEMEDFIISTDFSGQLKNYRETCRTEYEAAEAEVNYYRQALKTEAASEELTYYFDTALLKYECYGEKLGLADYLCEINAEYNDWRYMTVTVLINNTLNEKMSHAVMPEDMYLESYSIFDNYEKYVKGEENATKKADNVLAILNYSLENDIPTPYSLEKSVKLSWQNNFSAAIGYIRIFMIILAGTIVAGEFSSGSIRLLLIRPKKRSKILTSKLTASAFWSFVVIMAASIIMLILNVIVNGFSDVLIPDLIYLGGRVLAVPSFISTLFTIIIASIPAFMMFGLAFLFSVLTRKSALTIALSLILSTLYPIVSSLSTVLYEYLGFLAYTPFPYNDMMIFLKSPVGDYAYGLGGPLDIISGSVSYLYGNTGAMNVFTGIIVLVLSTSLILYFTYLSFSKQQIKN